MTAVHIGLTDSETCPGIAHVKPNSILVKPILVIPTTSRSSEFSIDVNVCVVSHCAACADGGGADVHTQKLHSDATVTRCA